MMEQFKEGLLTAIDERYAVLFKEYAQYNANVAAARDLIRQLEDARRSLGLTPLVKPDDPAYR